MRITPIVDRLKAAGLRNSYGALEFAGLKDAPRGTSFYAIPDEETAEANSLVGEAGASDQLVNYAFSVVIVMDAASRRDDRISEDLHLAKGAVIDAIADWRHPDLTRACAWAGGRLLDMDGSNLAWAVMFTAAGRYRRIT